MSETPEPAVIPTPFEAPTRSTLEETLKGIRREEAESRANRSMPPIPRNLRPGKDGKPPITLVLMYQYIEPAWSAKQTSEALGFVIALAKTHRVNGRGRCATEGLNMTLTAEAKSARDFCQALRDWNPIFNETDFKFTDGLD